MHAVVITEPGGPEVLRWTEVPDPAPGPGEVVINVAASAVNRADLMQRQGAYPPPTGAPPYPGLECSGTIAAVGDGVTGWRLGEQVCALLAGGGYAEKVAVPVGQLLPLPQATRLNKAAALPETVCTVYSNVFQLARLAKGETLLVHGGGSGIGTTAIQLARAFNAGAIFATAGTHDKCKVCEQLGATRGIDYKHEDFLKVVREMTANRGVDVVLDMVGGDYIPRNLSALARDGRHVSIATQRGITAEVNFLTVMMKRLILTGSTLRARSVEEKGAIAASLRREVWPLLDRGKVKPVIHRTFPLADVAAAHQLMESSAHIGKIVLSV